MSLRIRCPQCRTVQRVPAGVRPICPQCGFAGKSGAGQPQAVAMTTDGGGAAAAPDAATSEWGAPGASWGQPAQATATPAAQPANATWAEAPAAQPEAWPQSEETQQEVTFTTVEGGSEPEKKGWFRRKK